MTFPCIEVHMSNIEKRGFHSVTAPAASGMICGLGAKSYILGLDAVLGVIEERSGVKPA
jgi:3-dehydroquinate dehydratase-2